MSSGTRTTVYLKPEIHRALKVKSAEGARTVSSMINQAVLTMFREDAIDLEACEARRREPGRPFEKALEDLKRDGLL